MADDNRVLKMMEQSPLPQMVENLVYSLADAQQGLTMKAVEAILEMSKPENGIALPGETSKRSLLDLGFEPLFLHITEATITARVALSSTETTEYGVGGTVGATYGIMSASVNAHYSNKYTFSSEASSEIRTKVVSVPMPTVLSERFARRSSSGDGA